MKGPLTYEGRQQLKAALSKVQCKKEKRARRMGLGGESRPGWENGSKYPEVK